MGWLVYDALCRVLERRPVALGVAVYAFLVLAAWGLSHVFGARAAYIHIGAIIGTIMVANVAHVIIPGQRKMLAQIRRGEEPDPRPGLLGKTRSVHNTYFTLPVLFTMISNHYPMTYGSAYGWEALAVLSLASILVRQFFLLTHKQRYVPWLLVGAGLLVIVVALALAPRTTAVSKTVTFAEVAPIFSQRCAVCHAAHPTQPGFSAPPEGVLLDTPEHIKDNAARIDAQAVLTQNMPLGNLTNMTKDERAQIGAWISEGAKIEGAKHPDALDARARYFARRACGRRQRHAVSRRSRTHGACARHDRCRRPHRITVRRNNLHRAGTSLSLPSARTLPARSGKRFTTRSRSGSVSTSVRSGITSRC